MATIKSLDAQRIYVERRLKSKERTIGLKRSRDLKRAEQRAFKGGR